MGTEHNTQYSNSKNKINIYNFLFIKKEFKKKNNL